MLKMLRKARHLLVLASLVFFAVACDTTGGEDNTESDTGAPLGDTQSDSGSSSDTDVIGDAAGDSGNAVDTSVSSDVSSDAQVLPAFRTCEGLAADVSTSGNWRNSITSGGKAIFDDGHSIEDLIFVHSHAQSGAVEGKFAYGALSLDLEDEIVFGRIHDCSGDWVDLGQSITDSDGRARFELPATVFSQPGRYEVLMVVDGDGTSTRGYVLVVPGQTQFIVFDIDGTLTTDDGELFEEYIADLFGGNIMPEAYADAQTITRAYADAGYEVLYITGRPYFLSKASRGWLVDLGFPVGNLHLTRSLGESAPTESGVGAYKRDYLRQVMLDHRILRGYGNASTDIFAYGEAGIPKSETYIIGDNAGMDGTQAVTSYTDHLQQILIAPAQQPFTR